MVTKIFFRVFTTRFYSILCFPFRSIKGFEYILCNASLIVIFIFYIDVQLIWPHLLKKYSCIYGVALALLLKSFDYICVGHLILYINIDYCVSFAPGGGMS